MFNNNINDTEGSDLGNQLQNVDSLDYLDYNIDLAKFDSRRKSTDNSDVLTIFTYVGLVNRNEVLNASKEMEIKLTELKDNNPDKEFWITSDEIYTTSKSLFKRGDSKIVGRLKFTNTKPNYKDIFVANYSRMSFADTILIYVPESTKATGYLQWLGVAVGMRKKVICFGNMDLDNRTGLRYHPNVTIVATLEEALTHI